MRNCEIVLYENELYIIILRSIDVPATVRDILDEPSPKAVKRRLLRVLVLRQVAEKQSIAVPAKFGALFSSRGRLWFEDLVSPP